METFSGLKELVANPRFDEQRRAALNNLDWRIIDAPIVEIIAGLAKLPYCFTLQSCYGHFLYAEQPDPRNTAPLPPLPDGAEIDYRIAYIALCIQESEPGITLLRDLKQIPLIAPEYIQFGCAEWFWNRQVNSYALQVAPRRHMDKDRFFISYREALRVEQVRELFFGALTNLVQKLSPLP